MAPRKLSDADKQGILDLYRQPGETTSTLAERYGVSNSTISRVLKQRLPEAEYSSLIQQKRSGERSAAGEPVSADTASEDRANAEDTAHAAAVSLPEVDEESNAQSVEIEAPAAEAQKSARPMPKRRSRRRSTLGEDAPDSEQLSLPEAAASEEESRSVTQTGEVPFVSEGTESLDPEEDVAAIAVNWENAAAIEADDYEDDYEDDEDDDDWDEGDEADSQTVSVQRQEQIEIRPFSDAVLPKPCYLVTDRLSELITCPLGEFSELGQIPADEEKARTLPVFNNHRVARRFSRRNQRVIKVPDGMLIGKTQSYLQAKGITRLLVDGQVFALF